ncbi:MAG: DUF1223 domain-containing protein [Bdellovibrionota bacterium]|nr:DUF1223 domain-containing protein [Bdellovibrionota bacterium]
MRRIFLLSIYFISIPLLAKDYVSAENKVHLIELYSSEGCSSCPPAERQIASLLKHDALWKNFVPLNFHVDYWNRLGWVDPYSQKVFSQRQYEYSRTWGIRKVYTPAFVINAKNSGPSLNLPSKSKEKAKLQILVSHKFNEFSVKIKGHEKKRKYKVHFAYMANGLISHVNSGENKGRTLEQNFAVLDLKTKNASSEVAVFQINAAKVKAKSFSFAVWVTYEDDTEILQSIGAKL